MVLEAILEALEVDLGQVPGAVYKYLVWRNSSKSNSSSALNLLNGEVNIGHFRMRTLFIKEGSRSSLIYIR